MLPCVLLALDPFQVSSLLACLMLVIDNSICIHVAVCVANTRHISSELSLSMPHAGYRQQQLHTCCHVCC